MVKITHYEVYTDSGDGWKLEGRFSSDQRHEAINLSKEKEQEKLKVKIIRETFDVQDNSYQETVEYVSGLRGDSKSRRPPMSSVDARSYSTGGGSDEPNTQSEKEGSSGEIAKAILKLISIIILSLISANLLVSFLTPIVEDLNPDADVRMLLFIIFCVAFLCLAVPLILSKIPWYLFNIRQKKSEQPVEEKHYYDKAYNIIKMYNFNDYEPSVAPIWPEAPIEHKRYIIDFLKDIMNNVESKCMFEDSFSKFGVKLVVYGGCMELSRYCGLRITEANSLLFEAFKILDGENADLEAFYDGKKTFADNKIAVFLAGVGAHLMSQVISEQPMDSALLKQGFEKWEALLNGKFNVQEDAEAKEIDINCSCLVNVQCQMKFFDEAIPDANAQKESYIADIRNIIYNLLSKYRGLNVIEREEVTSVEYENTEDAVKFATEFIKNVGLYKEDLNNDNLLFLSKCNIVDKSGDEAADPENYISDVLEHTYNNEILVTEKIKNSMYADKYEFEFLGDKRLNKSGKLIALYKLIY